MSTRTPRNTGNAGNTGNTGTLRPPGNSANPGNVSNARNTGNSGSARTVGNSGNTPGTAGTAKTRSPIFSAEIEVYIKLKPTVEAALIEMKRTNPTSLPQYWRGWDLNAQNDDDFRVKAVQQSHVTDAVKGIIDGVLGDDNGWTCQVDTTLRDDWLQLGPGAPARKWWGVEIVTPPMSVSKHWQLEINMVWEELGKKFDFWTDDFCGFHVQVAPGPTRRDRYTLDQIVRTAKAVYFWESALCHIIEHNRKWNEYCLPNSTVFADHEVMSVPRHGWKGVFSKIDDAAATEPNLLDKLKGGESPQGWTRNISTNFSPLYERGTIALRRQGGVASALSTIRCILLAVTLHISALRYDFDKASTRKDRPGEEELIKELAGCIKRLPETCHGSRFVHWLKWCHESYAGNRKFTTQQINVREEALRNGVTPPNQPSYNPYSENCVPEASVLPAYVLAATAENAAPQGHQGVTFGVQGTGASARGGGGADGRGGAAQSSSTPSRTSAAQDGRGGAASGRGGAASGRGGAAPGPSAPSRPPAGPGGRGGGVATSGRGGAATGGRGGGSASGRGGGTLTGTARPPAANTSASAGGAPTRQTASTRTGGGTTTRLPERPAPPSSSRPVASSGNTTNTTAPTAGQRRRQQGEGA